MGKESINYEVWKIMNKGKISKLDPDAIRFKFREYKEILFCDVIKKIKKDKKDDKD
jgi:hypothetical protein